jgi:hypothetical protein
VVYEGSYEMPARVRGIDGVTIELERPTGLVWRAHYARLRPATEREKRQLAAVGRLHRQQCRGLT